MTLDYKNIFRTCPHNYVVMLPNSPKFTIVDVTEFHMVLLSKTRNEIIGFGLFEIYPENTGNSYSVESVDKLRQSLKYVVQNKVSHQLDVRKYDVPIGNGFETRFWQIENIPVFIDNTNEIHYILHVSIDITALSKMGIKIEDITN